VLDEVAAVDEVHRLALVDTGRPARDVAGDALPAIEDVELLDTGVRGGEAEPARQHRHSKSRNPFHVDVSLSARDVRARED